MSRLAYLSLGGKILRQRELMQIARGHSYSTANPDMGVFKCYVFNHKVVWPSHPLGITGKFLASALEILSSLKPEEPAGIH